MRIDMLKFGTIALAGAMILAGCAETTEPEPESAPSAAADVDCAPEGDLTYVCGVQSPEDLLTLGDTGRILVSGMSGNDFSGHIYLVNPADDSVEELFPGANPAIALDAESFPGCPGPLNVEAFSAHGLALRETDRRQFDLYITSHGEREAIEIFSLDANGSNPVIEWRGCVVLPENTFANSVAILSDGGFLTTKMMDPTVGFAAINGGEITGNLYEWHPGGEVFMMEGTELSGANGIAVSPDDRYVYVAAFGSGEIVRFDRNETPASKMAVPVDLTPDNVRWSNQGTLLTAGGTGDGWAVVEIDPETLETREVGGAGSDVAIQGVSSALEVGDNYWVGTFNGDRVAYFPKE